MCAQSGLARGPTVTEEARPTRRPSAGSPRWLFPPLAIRTQNLRTYVADLHVWKGDGGGGALGDNRRVSTSFILSLCPPVVRADAIRGGPIFDFRFCRLNSVRRGLKIPIIERNARWVAFVHAYVHRFMRIYRIIIAVSFLRLSYNHVSVKRYMYNQAQLCNRLFQHNVTSGFFELQMCLKLILIFISFDSAFLTNRVASQSISV